MKKFCIAGTAVPAAGSAVPISRVLRLLCLLCAAVLLLYSLPFAAVAETPAERYRRLREELEATRTQVNALKNNVAAAKELLEALEEEKRIIDEMVAINRAEIARVEDELLQKQIEIGQKQFLLAKNDRLLQQRLVVVYNMNSTGLLGQLLMVDDVSEFFLLADILRRVSQHDTALLDTLSAEKAALDAQQAEVAVLLADLQTYHAELLANQTSLAQNILDANEQLSEAQAQLAAQQAIAGQQYAALEAAQREMAAVAGSIGGSRPGDGSTFVGGVFRRPIQNGIGYVSCEFGQPDPNGRAHRGMDIACASGTDIVACGKGRVIAASYAHSSYGNYIVVDHGDGIKSLYAHCTALLAAVGTEVQAGDIIATVGATGFVTGPHLHWEVQVGGVVVNPRGYMG